MKAMLRGKVEQTHPFLQSLPQEVRASWLGAQVRVSSLQFSFLYLLWTDHLVVNLLQADTSSVGTAAHSCQTRITQIHG